MPSRTSLSSFVLVMLVVLASGMITAFQHGMNSRFSKLAGHGFHGGMLNFVVGFLAAATFWLVLGKAQAPNREAFTTGPWWMWLGGVGGAIYVCVAIFALPRIGGAYYISALVIGQLAAAMFIDHFGLVGMEEKSITPGKVIGLGLMVAGVACMKFL